jgi:protocatechuate 3,4-dioxygenase beta subunit
MPEPTDSRSIRPSRSLVAGAHADDHPEDFGGLHHDLRRTGATMDRRQMLRLAAMLGGSVGALHLLGCDASTTDLDDGDPGACSRIPEETAGPFPGEGSNGPNVLNQTGVVRNDIRSSFAGLSGTADGVRLDLALTIVSASSCAPLSGAAVYLWLCDRLGRYSLYTAGVTNQNYLRGVQPANASGVVTFTSIFPGCYPGRWPHIHFEVFPSVAAATNVANKIATSQIALPKTACDLVYATAGYQSSVGNLAQLSLATDNVFSDGSALELATVTGDVASGLTATLTVAVPG